MKARGETTKLFLCLIIFLSCCASALDTKWPLRRNIFRVVSPDIEQIQEVGDWPRSVQDGPVNSIQVRKWLQQYQGLLNRWGAAPKSTSSPPQETKEEVELRLAEDSFVLKDILEKEEILQEELKRGDETEKNSLVFDSKKEKKSGNLRLEKLQETTNIQVEEEQVEQNEPRVNNGGGGGGLTSSATRFLSNLLGSFLPNFSSSSSQSSPKNVQTKFAPQLPKPQAITSSYSNIRSNVFDPIKPMDNGVIEVISPPPFPPFNGKKKKVQEQPIVVSSGYAQVTKATNKPRQEEEEITVAKKADLKQAFCRQAVSATLTAKRILSKNDEERHRSLVKRKLYDHLWKLSNRFEIDSSEVVGPLRRRRNEELESNRRMVVLLDSLCGENLEFTFGATAPGAGRRSPTTPSSDENNDNRPLTDQSHVRKHRSSPPTQPAAFTTSSFPLSPVENRVKPFSSLKRNPVLTFDEPEIITLNPLNNQPRNNLRRRQNVDDFVVSTGLSFGNEKAKEVQQKSLPLRRGSVADVTEQPSTTHFVKKQGQPFLSPNFYGGSNPVPRRPVQRRNSYYFPPSTGTLFGQKKTDELKQQRQQQQQQHQRQPIADSRSDATRPFGFQAPRPPFQPPPSLRPIQQNRNQQLRQRSPLPASPSPRPPTSSEFDDPFFAPAEPTTFTSALGSFIEPTSRNWQESFHKMQRQQQQNFQRQVPAPIRKQRPTPRPIIAAPETYYPQHPQQVRFPPVEPSPTTKKFPLTLHQIAKATREQPEEVSTVVPNPFAHEVQGPSLSFMRDVRQSQFPSHLTGLPGFAATESPPTRNYTQFDNKDAIGSGDRRRVGLSGPTTPSALGQEEDDLHYVYNVTFYTSDEDDDKEDERYFDISSEGDQEGGYAYYSYEGDELPPREEVREENHKEQISPPGLPGFRFEQETRKFVEENTSTYYPEENEEEEETTTGSSRFADEKILEDRLRNERPGFTQINREKQQANFGQFEKEEEENISEFQSPPDDTSAWGTKTPPTQERAASELGVAPGFNRRTTPAPKPPRRRPTIRMAEPHRGGSKLRIPPLINKNHNQHVHTRPRNHHTHHTGTKGIGGAEVSSGLSSREEIFKKLKHGTGGFHPGGSAYREEQRPQFHLPENLLDPSTLRRRNLTASTTTTTTTTSTTTTTTTTTTTMETTPLTTTFETYFPTTNFGAEEIIYEYEYIDETTEDYTTENNNVDYDARAGYEITAGERDTEGATERNSETTSEEPSRRHQSVDHDSKEKNIHEHELHTTTEEEYYDNEIEEEEEEQQDAAYNEIVVEPAAGGRNDRFAKAGLPNSHLSLAPELGDRQEISDLEAASVEDEPMNPEKLAYILIGVCCGLSILCLIVVAVSIGYKSETHYRLDDGTRKRHIKLLKASSSEEGSSAASSSGASTTSSPYSETDSSSNTSENLGAAAVDLSGMKLGPWFNGKHAIHTLERKGGLAFPTSVYLENLEGGAGGDNDAASEAPSKSPTDTGSLSSFDTLRTDPNLFPDPSQHPPRRPESATSEEEIGASSALYKKKKTSYSLSTAKKRQESRASQKKRGAPSSSGSRRRGGGGRTSEVTTTGSFRFIGEDEVALSEEQPTSGNKECGEIQWSSNKDRLI